MSEPRVRVRLTADCVVDGLVRHAGEIVEIEQSLAEAFGVQVDAAGRPRPAKPAATENSDDEKQ